MNKNRIIFVSFFVVLLAFTSISMFQVQSYTPTYTGTVTGEKGDPIAHARVEFLESGVEKKHTFTSDGSNGNVGEYSISYTTTRFGIYSIRVSKPNYHWQSKGVVSNPRPGFFVDFQLELVDDPITTFAGCVREEGTAQYISGAGVDLKLDGQVVETTSTSGVGNYFFYDIVGVLGTSIEYEIEVTHVDYTTASAIVYTNSQGDGWHWENFFMNDDPPPPPPVIRYGLIIGINDYAQGDEDGPFYDLDGAVNDANAWYSWFDSDIEFTELTKLTDSQATRENIFSAITTINNEVEAGATFALIFSGHGANDADNYNTYLCTYECDPDDDTYQTGYIEEDELADALEITYFSKIFVFLDSCHSGGFARGFSSSNFNFNGEFLMLMAAPEELTTTELNYPDNRGAWSYYFLDYAWITYKNGQVDINLVEVFGYAISLDPPGINCIYRILMGFPEGKNAEKAPVNLASFTI